MFYRILFPEAVWRIKRRGRKVAYLTFDDGPIPEVTPQILDILDRFGVKATFFMVGDNARRNPWLVEEVRRRGHSIGNHTMHHLQGRKTRRRKYLRDVKEADFLLGSSLFRPPHGLLRWGQSAVIRKHYNLIMYDVVTRDYAVYMTPDEVVSNVRHFARNGSIIVFHDSLKSMRNTLPALPEAIKWLQENGFELLPLITD
ncbi:MAG: polysaccharide deacetylase family protein [Muribaculaceae bacterium]|nr:polysaccharide deacetylase family protein [Muribaculaceae bacterium]MDE6165769.1 polysaccharide deacetylase family protein [Muribaculaceae bacterium]MDE6366764.1 polysaccharide deacetylase family protein [Muribaculaceae bacterium]